MKFSSPAFKRGVDEVLSLAPIKAMFKRMDEKVTILYVVSEFRNKQWHTLETTKDEEKATRLLEAGPNRRVQIIRKRARKK